MKKVLTAMSGGVDSSVAVILLKNSGYEPYGVTMELLNGIKGISPFTEKQTANKIAEKMGIGFEAVDYSDEFEKQVIKPFVDSYISGSTPNPCIECNKHLKFGKLYAKADEMGIKYIATGHYSVIEESNGEFFLRKAKDIKKDQSYVLYGLTQEKLSRLILPLGNLTKEEIRSIAAEYGLPNANKSDSQDICFIKDREYFDFVSAYSGIPSESGKFIDINGKVIGSHNGYIRYTVGQRRGLGFGFGERMYVVNKNAGTNTVTLGTDDDLYSKTMLIDEVNMISGKFPENDFRAKVKIRYQHKEQPAVIHPLENQKLSVEFDEPQRAIASGQSGVIYDDDYVIGGGKIV